MQVDRNGYEWVIVDEIDCRSSGTASIGGKTISYSQPVKRWWSGIRGWVRNESEAKRFATEQEAEEKMKPLDTGEPNEHND